MDDGTNVVTDAEAFGFWGWGYRAIMITDGAEFRNPNYHCMGGEDAVTTLDHDFAVKIALGALASTRNALQASE